MSRSANRPGWTNALLTAWLTVGVLDLADALLFFGLRGARLSLIPQSIAAAFLGPAAFRLGWKSVALGVVVHFAIAFVLTLVYFLVFSERVTAVQAVLFGLLYGAATYCVVNFVLLPFTRMPSGPRAPAVLLNGVLAHLFLVGLPIALCARRATANPR